MIFCSVANNRRSDLFAAGSIMTSKLVSPADSCAEFGCDSGIMPGYDLYISESCLPSRNGPVSTCQHPNDTFEQRFDNC